MPHLLNLLIQSRSAGYQTCLTRNMVPKRLSSRVLGRYKFHLSPCIKAVQAPCWPIHQTPQPPSCPSYFPSFSQRSQVWNISRKMNYLPNPLLLLYPSLFSGPDPLRGDRSVWMRDGVFLRASGPVWVSPTGFSRSIHYPGRLTGRSMQVHNPNSVIALGS